MKKINLFLIVTATALVAPQTVNYLCRPAEAQEANTPPERPGSGQRGPVNFEMLDADGDGSVTMEEFVNVAVQRRANSQDQTVSERRKNRREKIFSRIDADEDGELSEEEFEKWRDTVRDRTQNRRGRQ